MLVVAVGALSGFVAGQGIFTATAPGTGGPRPTGTEAAQVGPPATGEASALPTTSGGLATPSPTPLPTPTPPDLIGATVPLVPVVSFWSEEEGVSSERLRSIVSGGNSAYSHVVILEGSSAAVAQALGGQLGPSVSEATLDELGQAVADGALGLLPLPQVSVGVRALAVDGISLFGNGHVESLEAWPLFVTMQLPAFTWDQGSTWTLVAGGDILLDRGVAQQVSELDKGVDYPWDGGTAVITGRHCCSSLGWTVPDFERTGNRGAVRDLFSGADLAIANLESPVREDFTYHPHGLIFTGDPLLLDGIKNAGLDMVSLANNHIANGGRQGIVDTANALDDLDLAYAGAGLDVATAARPAILRAGGQKVAIVACAVVGGHFATADDWGGLRCGDDATEVAITDAAGRADTVIVFPHWGHEYNDEGTRGMKRLSERWFAIGADLVIGSHPHWAGGIGQIDGKLVFYTLGNLVFDQIWAEEVMEGLIVELTFQGDRVVQARVHPTLIIDSQPNLLEYDGGGADVLARVRRASTELPF